MRGFTIEDLQSVAGHSKGQLRKWLRRDHGFGMIHRTHAARILYSHYASPDGLEASLGALSQFLGVWQRADAGWDGRFVLDPYFRFLAEVAYLKGSIYGDPTVAVAYEQSLVEKREVGVFLPFDKRGVARAEVYYDGGSRVGTLAIKGDELREGVGPRYRLVSADATHAAHILGA